MTTNYLTRMWDHIAQYLIGNSEKILLSVILIIIIIILAKVIKKIAEKITRISFDNRIINKGFKTKDSIKKTVLSLVLGIQRYFIYIIAFSFILRVVGLSLASIIASAGALGLAFGFAAQNVLKDIISGFFLIFEGLINEGDVITVGDVSGEIEKISLRNTLIREYGGRIWSIPNGEIRKFGNFNRDFCRAIVEVNINWEENVNNVLTELQGLADRWAEKNSDLVLEPPVAQGVMAFNESNLTLRIVVKVKPQKHWGAQVELNKLVKEKLESLEINPPLPRRVVTNK